ncbi:MAG: PAS domain-containing protein [Hyphomonadaceae bacterium]
MHSRERISGATEAQQNLLEYWQSKRREQSSVARADICPGELRLYLANISLVHVDRRGEARFRLAGSRLRDILGVEARGRQVSDIPNLLDEAWVDGLHYVLETGKPAGGINQHGEDAHAWLRLPLHDSEGRLCIVLCHDELTSGCDTGRISHTSEASIRQFLPREAA